MQHNMQHNMQRNMQNGMPSTMVDDDYDISLWDVLAATQRALTKSIREEFPYMRTSHMEEAIEATLTTVRQKVEDAKPQMTASKARTSFFTLPAELRNAIYDLAFAPTSEGDYRARFNECEFRTEQKGLYRGDDTRCYTWRSSQEVHHGMPPLLLTSSKVRAEAMPIFLSHLTVFVSSDRFGRRWNGHVAFPAAKEWFKALGPKQVKHIKKFVLEAVSAGAGPSNEQVWERLGFEGFGLEQEAIEHRSVMLTVCY